MTPSVSGKCSPTELTAHVSATRNEPPIFLGLAAFPSFDPQGGHAGPEKPDASLPTGVVFRFMTRSACLLLIACLALLPCGIATAQQNAQPATAAATACGAKSDAVDQAPIYAQPRDYSVLSGHSDVSFPNLMFFLGLNGVRCSQLLGDVPTYVPICAADPGQNSLSARLSEVRGVKSPDAIANEIRQTYRDIRAQVYRLRMCDFLLSVYAWNTRQKEHQASFDYSWRTACNSFAYESDQGVKLTGAVDKLVQQTVSASPADLSATLTQFAYTNYDLYDDLSGRLASCAAIVSGLTYPPNTNRFFCRYGGFIGALASASSVAFGKHWGTNTSTQGQVAAIGTLFAATSALCQNAQPSGPKG